MSTPLVFAGSASYRAPVPGPVVSIGNFDGVHRGHRAMLEVLLERAGRAKVPSLVYTFEPPPRVVLAPQHHVPRISPWPDKVRLLIEFGVEHVVVERFTRAFAQHPPEWFADRILRRRLGAQAIVVGYDFRFGKARGGDVDRLREILPEIPIVEVPAFALDGEVVSSSSVRRAIAEGDVERAAVLLGRPHIVRGTVVTGDRRGRKLGFPTANLEVDTGVLPLAGVYAVRASADGGAPEPAVANLGVRPTFEGEKFLVEVHLLDASPDLYGKELEVGFVRRIRDEKRFSGPDELVAQIRKDVDQARAMLGSS
jgi:riboflavin kinase/FMN adenylyltransferase